MELKFEPELAESKSYIFSMRCEGKRRASHRKIKTLQLSTMFSVNIYHAGH